MGCRTFGTAGTGQLRLKWRHFSPALTNYRRYDIIV
jgi:hypothetical protein